MLLLFHKGISDQGLHGVIDTFKLLDKYVYVAAVFEDDDDCSAVSNLSLRCLAGVTLLCEHHWQLVANRNVYTMWFDLARIENKSKFPAIPLVAEAALDGEKVLTAQATLSISTVYTKTGVLGGLKR